MPPLFPFHPITTLSSHHSIPRLARGQGVCARTAEGMERSRGRERERTGREGCWHLQPGHLLKRGMFLPDVRQSKRARERVSCFLRMSECHWPLHSLSSTLCLFDPLSLLEARSLQETMWQRESERDWRVLHCLALVAWKHVLFRIRGDAVAGAELYFCYIYTTAC